MTSGSVDRRVLKQALVIVALVFAGLMGVVACVLKRSKDQRDLQQEGREFCEKLLPRLEEFKRASGSYPASIGDFLQPADVLPPILLDPNNLNSWYWRDDTGQTFMFFIQQTGRFEAYFAPLIYCYSSEEKVWAGSGG